MRLLIFFLLAATGWTQTGMMRVQRRAAAAPAPVLIQSRVYACGGGTSCTIDAAHGSLAAVGTGHLVIVNANTSGEVPTGVTSSPSAAWESTDVFGNISMYTICNSSAFTAITLSTVGAEYITLRVSEFAGTATSSCVDKVATVASCEGGSTYTTGLTGTVSQNSTLLFVWGMWSDATGSATTASPYTLLGSDNGAGASSIWAGYQIVNTSPASYSASGAVLTSGTCFSNIAALKGI